MKSLDEHLHNIFDNTDISGRVYHEDSYTIVEFEYYTSAGQDFCFSAQGETLKELWENLISVYNDFDPSHEAYLWLDEDGHGKNGAPYEMIDVYNDMIEGMEKINDAADMIYNYYYSDNYQIA